LAARYALVAVNAPTRPQARPELGAEQEGAYHYAVPPALRGRLQPGQMVWVPFGARRLGGIITGLADSAPPLEVREIAGLATEEPVVISSQVALARWMAREYLAPLGRALWLMLPPGIGRRLETRVQAAASELPVGTALSPNQRVVWEALRGRPATPLKQVGNLARVAGWREALAALEEKGLVRRWDGERQPAVRPQTERFLRPTATSEAAAELNRAPRQRAVFEFLCAQCGEGDSWLAQSEVLAATHAARQAVDALMARGLLEAEEREVWRDPLAGREFVLASPPQLTPEQEQALRAVGEALGARRPETFLLHGVTGSG
jgi:primosomal protein N' (replication factor Y)